MRNMIGLMCASAMVLRAKEGEGGGGTAVLPEGEFQQRVISTQQKTGKQVEDLTTNFDNLQKETKKAFEELTELKNKGADVEKLSQSVQKVQLAMRREKRLAYGDPVQRISNDPEMKASLNAAVRAFSHGAGGDLGNVAKDIIQRTGLESSGFGATLIVNQLLNEIFDTLALYGVWNTFAVRRMGTLITQMPVKTARAAAGWLTTEGALMSEDTAKAGTSVNLQVYPIAVFLSLSLQLLQDAEFDVTADVMTDFVEGFNYVLDNTVLNGDGTAGATYNGQTGVFNFGTAQVAKTTHTSIASLTFEDITAMLLGVDVAVLSRAARWWMHPFVLVQMLSIKDLNGRPIFLTAFEAPTPNALGSILGYPVTPSNAAPAPIGTSAGAKVAAFGDPQGMVVGMRQDFAIEASDHFKFANYERSFRGVGRAGIAGRRAQAFSVLQLAAS